MLTPAQLQTLEADIANTPEAAAMMAAGSMSQLADYYNALTPAFVIWRTAVPKDEIQADPGYNFTRVDNMSVGKARVWAELFETGAMHPHRANVRAGVAAAWTGTAQDLAVQDVVIAHCKRLASRFEQVFAVGLGTTVSPATMSVEGPATTDIFVAVRDLP